MLYQVLVTICDSCVNFLSLDRVELVIAMMRYLCELAHLAPDAEKLHPNQNCRRFDMQLVLLPYKIRAIRSPRDPPSLYKLMSCKSPQIVREMPNARLLYQELWK